jgi:hypothetical protein
MALVCKSLEGTWRYKNQQGSNLSMYIPGTRSPIQRRSTMINVCRDTLSFRLGDTRNIWRPYFRSLRTSALLPSKPWTPLLRYENTTEQKAQCTRHEAKVQYLKVIELHVSWATCYINHERSLNTHTRRCFERSKKAGTKSFPRSSKTGGRREDEHRTDSSLLRLTILPPLIPGRNLVGRAKGSAVRQPRLEDMLSVQTHRHLYTLFLLLGMSSGRISIKLFAKNSNDRIVANQSTITTFTYQYWSPHQRSPNRHYAHNCSLPNILITTYSIQIRDHWNNGLQ